MRKLPIIGLALWASLSFAQPPGPPINPAGGSGTVTGPGAACVDNQIARWDGATTTALQCSVLTIADTTGNITGPAGGFSIIGGTGATDELILDGSAGTTGNVKILATGEIINRGALNVGYDWVTFRAGGSIGWESGGSVNTGGIYGDTRLYRDGAGILAQRVVGTAQTYRLYNTYTDASNYERLSLSGVARSSVDIKAETAGTGADDLSVNVSGSGVGTVNLTRARIVPSAAPPVTCAAGTEGALYVDSDTHKLCYCNGSGWVLASDDSTGCS